ncbi:MAG: carbohydrate kinase family protein [Tannerella sp.]|jgi:sugar/nucleoside kinase (ribokinase family)|nr:carbohydrate kinase family protein [Tannerella sp.]
MDKKLIISGTGCALVDYLYKPVYFTDEKFSRFMSLKPGDGGLSPGKLVFSEEFEKFSGEDYLAARERITNGQPPVAQNIGGPSIVSLIHVAQMLARLPAEVRFYGSKGRDAGADFIDERLKLTPLKIGKYKTANHYTPFTDVLSDPSYDNGHGERIFINNIGAAWEMYPEDLDDDFFKSDIVVFGGTALVPNIHRSLSELLIKSKDNHAITVVNTVYDFLNEKQSPDAPWPLGNRIDSYRLIDLLITDMEEALRLSGQPSIHQALDFFKAIGIGASIVTHGANPVYYYSQNKLFGRIEGCQSVSSKVVETLARNPELAGDTTGCGDNFTGGVIASMAEQIMQGLQPGENGFSNAGKNVLLDFEDAIAHGIASGGYTCFYHGGTFYEEFPGQKRQLIEPYYKN